MFVTPDPGPAPSEEQSQGLLRLVRAALMGGVDAVQLRAKELASGPLFVLAAAMEQECARQGAELIVNDRLDVALAAGASGVQLGERSLPLAAAGRIASSYARAEGLRRLLIGASVHDLAGVRTAASAGADYLIYGNVFLTMSKPGLTGRGLDALGAAVQAAGACPLLAIGGVDAGNAGDVRKAGASGIAVIGAIAAAQDPAGAAARLVAAWRREGGGPGSAYHAQ